MSRLTIFLTLLLSLHLLQSTYQTTTISPKVLELTPRTLDRTLTQKTLVEFYAPWCSHCKQFASSYLEIAKELEGDHINVAKVDGHKYRVLSLRFGVIGFPSFYLVEGDNVWEFDGIRSVEGLVAFARERKDGKLVTSGWKHPVGVYWKGVGWVLGEWERVVEMVKEKQISKSVLIGGGVVVLGIVLGSFLMVIYLVTKPNVRPKRD